MKRRGGEIRATGKREEEKRTCGWTDARCAWDGVGAEKS